MKQTTRPKAFKCNISNQEKVGKKERERERRNKRKKSAVGKTKYRQPPGSLGAKAKVEGKNG